MSNAKEEMDNYLNNLYLNSEYILNENLNNNRDKINELELSKKKLFMFQIIQILNSNLKSYKESIKRSCNLYEVKCDTLKNFMFNSIPKSILELKITEIIKILERTKNMSNEEIRKSLSSENNPIHAVKLAYDMNKICTQISNSTNRKKENINSTEKNKHLNSQNINKYFNPKLIYASPSPVINHKSKNRNKSPQSQKKNNYQTPEKNIWKV
jgi:hypothetical protein